MSEQILSAIRYINGHPYVKVKDLADAWHTSTSSILATGKPNQVPEKYRKTIEGRTWCDVDGLRYRLKTMKRGGKIREQLNQLLEHFTEDEPESSSKETNSPVGKDKKEAARMRKARMERKIFKTSTTIANTHPTPQDIETALNNEQIIVRKKDYIQVLAQTLSNFLGTRTSSLLAVNKKHGVPEKFIHREWKATWVDLEGLKERANHTEHWSVLLANLRDAIFQIESDVRAMPVVEAWERFVKARESANAERQAKPETQEKCGTKLNPIDVCEVEANKRAVHNTERLNKLTRDEKALENLIFSTRDVVSTDLGTQSKRLDMLADRIHRIEAGDKQATEAMAEKRTPFDALSRRVAGINTHTDRLDSKTDGLASRVSVLEDTSKWLSWSLAGLVSLRFLGLTLRWLKRK